MVVRCALESLALAYRRTFDELVEVLGKPLDAIHIVGGGSQNRLLCQLTADACGLPVLAGPVEATALGNILVQARTAGVVNGGLEAMRTLLRETVRIVRYEPGGDPAAWRSAERRLEG